MKMPAPLLVVAVSVAASATEVTVYNSNLGLVKEVRPLTLTAGVNEVRVEDVAARIDPTSVHFKSLRAPDAARVVEQDFRYDLASQDAILQRYLGREIELTRPVGRDGEKTETISGVLLSNAGGRVLQSGGKILINPPGEPVLGALPEGLLTRPTLVWTLDASRSGTQDGEISYLTAGLSWSADYVLVVDKDDSSGDLTAWVTVTNDSGATYRDAKLKLVAGDVHRAPRPPRALPAGALAMAGRAEMTENPFFEYHLYALQRPTTLADRSSKQVQMAAASGVPVRKSYVYDGAERVRWSDPGGRGIWDPGYGLESSRVVSVFLELRNRASDGLGLPLPQGRVRVYKADDDGSLQLAGEDEIDHTPKDETVRVRMGDAFDVVGERRRVDYSSDAKKRRAEESFEIRLRNHKDAGIAVDVVEHLYRGAGWTIASASAKWEKKDAQTIMFHVPVPKDGEAVVAYAVRYAW